MRRGPKAPPPAHGIKMKSAGTTWWGKLWIEALEKMSPDYASRLARGKSYARAGRTHDLVVRGGTVTAQVTGSRPQPYDVKIELVPLDDAAWEKAFTELASKARYAAQLLAGEMPEDVDTVLRAVSVSVFPSQLGDLTTSCSCPDWANPCKHVAAAHYVLGEAFDRDPFLLFELRGRSRERVLTAVKAASRPEPLSTGAAAKRKASKHAAAADDAPSEPGVRLGPTSEADYDAWRGSIPALRFTFAAPDPRTSLVASLGTPPSWQPKSKPADALAPLIRSAADLARELATRARD